ncbi:hypothetical protein JCM3765_004361 [Sporobolomyces pararoseus]
MIIPLAPGLGFLEAHLPPWTPNTNPLFQPPPPPFHLVMNDPFYSDNIASESAAARLLKSTALRYNVLTMLNKPDSETPQLDVKFKKTLKHCINQVDLLEEEKESIKEMKLTPILYHWEIFTGFGITTGDFSNLVFTDRLQTKYFLLTCIPFPENRSNCARKRDDEAVLKRQALRFLALAHYLPIPKPQFVRATLLSTEYDSFNPTFFDPDSNTSTFSSSSSPAIYHLTSDDLVPIFTAQEFSKLDNYLKTFGVTGNDSIKSRILISPDVVNSDSNPMKIQLESENSKKYYETLDERWCGHCQRNFTVPQLKACSFCSAELYCSVECQKKDWKDHKRLCKGSYRLKKDDAQSG